MLTTTSLILTVLDVLRYVAILIQTRSGIMSSTTMWHQEFVNHLGLRMPSQLTNSFL